RTTTGMMARRRDPASTRSNAGAGELLVGSEDSPLPAFPASSCINAPVGELERCTGLADRMAACCTLRFRAVGVHLLGEPLVRPGSAKGSPAPAEWPPPLYPSVHAR